MSGETIQKASEPHLRDIEHQQNKQLLRFRVQLDIRDAYLSDFGRTWVFSLCFDFDQKISFNAIWVSLLEVEVESKEPAFPTAAPVESNNVLFATGELKLE
jgi:hypothetical protein